MKVPAPALLPILRSDVVGRVLAILYLAPDEPRTLSALAQLTGASTPTLTREASRMVTAGLVTEQRIGNTRQLRANRDARTYRPLRELLVLTYGPAPVLAGVLAEVPGIDSAWIYGSWAARHEGVEGPEPRDVDVLVVGTPDPDDLYGVSESTGRLLGREVNIRTVSAAAWEEPMPTDPFLRHVHDSPLVKLETGSQR